MRACVEPSRFEVMTRVLENGRGRVRQRGASACDKAIDIEDAKPDSFHVKRRDGTRKRFAFVDERRSIGGLGLQQLDELMYAVAGRRAMVVHSIFSLAT
jgi:hypothetical protein